MTNDGTSPTSWRDVYSLVQDVEGRLMHAVGGVDGKVTDLQKRVGGIEADRRDERVAREVESTLATARDARASKQRRTIADIAMTARGSIALIISLVTFGLLVLRG